MSEDRCPNCGNPDCVGDCEELKMMHYDICRWETDCLAIIQGMENTAKGVELSAKHLKDLKRAADAVPDLMALAAIFRARIGEMIEDHRVRYCTPEGLESTKALWRKAHAERLEKECSADQKTRCKE